MVKKFYVDVNALGEYTKFLNKSVKELNMSTDKITKANNNYQSSMRDEISVQVDMRVKKLRKIFDNFSQEVNKMNKEIKEDYALYCEYLKKLK